MSKRLSILLAGGALIGSLWFAGRVPAASATDWSANQQWFRNAGFGMFIHWGVYSVLGDGEWVMENHHMSVSDYEKLPPQFDPTKFDAVKWVSLAKRAGVRYITITSKHHDGFAMFATKQSDWNIVDRTPYRKDPLKMLADECHRQGIKLFFYYSELDWHNPDYYPLGRTGHASGRPASGDWNRYLGYMNAQLSELLTNYAPIAGIWFDGWWDRPDADWKLDETYGLIHRLDPDGLVGSNHHHAPNPGEDFQMFEKDLPGKKTQEFNSTSQVGALPLEMCQTINDAWGYNKNDLHFKSPTELVQMLVNAAGSDSNLLLNIGPLPTGEIEPEFAARLEAMGIWLRANGESIYGARGGPIPPQDWGVSTHKGNRVYLHILKPGITTVTLPDFKAEVTSAHLLNGPRIGFAPDNSGAIVVQVPPAGLDPVDTIVVLETKPR